MSKSFTALGVLSAVQDGLLDLDAPVAAYLPDFRVQSRYEERPEAKMTLRLLLAHRAGFTHEAPLGGNYDSRPHAFEEHIASFASAWLRYPVGYRYSYSNMGIDLAGYILEKKSGLPFWRCIQEKVFRPLGMSESTMNFDEIKKAENRAVGHTDLPSIPAGGIPVEIPMIPSGGVYTNIRDMAAYLRFFINGGRAGGKTILRPDLFEQMTSPAFPEKNQRFGYGLGIERVGHGTTYALFHGGGGYGFSSSMTIYPELKLGVVTLSQDSSINSDRIMRLIQPLIGAAREPDAAGPGAAAGTPPARLSPSDERIRKLCGIYQDGLRIEFQQDVPGGVFRGKFTPLEFFAEADGIMGLADSTMEIRVKPPRLGQPGTLIALNRAAGRVGYYDFLQPLPAQDRPGPDKPEWKAYEGTYRNLFWGLYPRPEGLAVRVVNGYLTLNGARCVEHQPGLFFTPDGEALDFRGTIPSYRNTILFRAKS
jgi:CubicO group peptidase (beta-lactamase class C family)